jgi:hypothetical protein
MTNQLTEYKRFTLNATAFKNARGYVPRICITHHNGANTTEMILDPPCSTSGFEKEEDALNAAIKYGRMAIDGNISGVDTSKMC